MDNDKARWFLDPACIEKIVETSVSELEADCKDCAELNWSFERLFDSFDWAY